MITWLGSAGFLVYNSLMFAFAAGARPGLAAGYLAGLLVAWIAVQLLILRRYFFLQPVIAGIGAAEVLLAWRWQRAAGRPGREDRHRGAGPTPLTSGCARGMGLAA